MSGRIATPVLVAGLGRFGSALAATLMHLGHDVLAVDGDARIVQRYAADFTHVVEADSTNPDALRQLGVTDLEVAVVGIGADMEASILTVAALADLRVPNIWAKAATRAHGRILSRVGAHHVVLPEHEMGERVAHILSGRMIDFIQLDEGFALVETTVPSELVDRSLTESQVRARWGITVVCIKPVGGSFTYATADTVPRVGDTLVVAGKTSYVQKFAESA